MAFPRVGNTLGDDAASADEARDAWAAVANAAAGFEPVTMVVDPSAVAEARTRLSGEIELVEAPLDDYWMRDIGPTFVLGDDGALGAVDWTFNGWGANAWATWERDDRIASIVAGLAGAVHLPSPLVNEGGGIHVDGEGTVLLTETVQLDPRRNPYTTKQRVEWELQRTLGATNFIWLPRGLTRDYESAGTRGHVDMVATFARARPRAAALAGRPVAPRLRGRAPGARRARSRRRMPRAGASRSSSCPLPTTLRDEDGFVDWNYANHLVVNGGVIACGYGEPDADARAAGDPRRRLRPRGGDDRRAARSWQRGGGIHCITQQQPSTTSRSSSECSDEARPRSGSSMTADLRRRGVHRRAPRALERGDDERRAGRGLPRPHRGI